MSESAPRGSQVPSAAVPGLEHAVDHSADPHVPRRRQHPETTDRVVAWRLT
jgi:hypothetical protein